MANGQPKPAFTPPQITPGCSVYVSFSAEIIPATAETLLGTLAQISQQGAKTVHLLLSTPGGSVMNGLNLYNMLRALPIKLVTHNVGNVDSIGNVVFLAGEERYCAAHATFMFHGVGFDILNATRFDERVLRERMDSIKADQERIGAIMAERSKLTMEEVRDLFLEARTRDPGYAVAKGIAQEIREPKVPEGAPLIQLVFKR